MPGLLLDDLGQDSGRRRIAWATDADQPVDDDHADPGEVALADTLKEIAPCRMLCPVQDDEVCGTSRLDEAAIEAACPRCVARLIWVAVGGRNVLLAAFLGALLVRSVEGELSDRLGDYWLLALGMLFVLTVVLMPTGLFGRILMPPVPKRLRARPTAAGDPTTTAPDEMTSASTWPDLPPRKAPEPS
jgi:hypothetical protein